MKGLCARENLRGDIKFMNMILLGPPGAGKGTQAQVLKDKMGLRHISTGNIFRRLIASNEPLGIKIKKYVETGELVPDAIVVETVKNEIEGKETARGFVLDGFPRTLNQAQILDKTLKETSIFIDKVFYFDTSEDVIIDRLSGRRICQKCGATYHIRNIPPKKPGICDRCGSNLYQRKDDAPDTIHNRLKVYKEQTEELIAYYRNIGLLETIDGNLSKDKAFSVLKEKL